MVGFRCWPLDLWLGFLSPGSRYLKPDFRIGFLVSSHISENYWLLQQWSITWWSGDYFRLVLSRLRDTCIHRNKSTWVPKGSLSPSEFVFDLMQARTAFFHNFSWFLGFQNFFMVPADYQNQLFGRVAGICWNNDPAHWIRKVLIDIVPKYLSGISWFSLTFLSP